MAILPIRTFGDPVLRLETKTVVEVDDALQALAVDMIETMYQAPGVGLAANQIGISRRIAVFDAQDGLGPRVMINPEIVELSGEWAYEEGCLSVPGHYWEIKRPGFAQGESHRPRGQRSRIRRRWAPGSRACSTRSTISTANCCSIGSNVERRSRHSRT